MISSDPSSARLQSAAFYAFLVAVIVVPIAFWLNQYFALETVKTVLISMASIIGSALLLASAFRSREIHLPPRPFIWIGVLMAISVVASALGSGHFAKSFMGQGFEIGTGSLILVLFVTMFAVYRLVVQRVERGIMLYVGVISPFLALFLFHLVRLFGGPGVASFGFLNTVTATIIGSWYGLAIYAVTVAIILLVAVIFLPLSSRLRYAYWAIIILTAAWAFFVNNRLIWEASALVLLGLTIYLTLERSRPEGSAVAAFLKRLAWIPLGACLISIVLVYQGTTLATPIIAHFNAGYSELSLPWQMTLDVATNNLKADPILGSGPNRFSQAFLANKPAGINGTDAWGVEFNTGFGLIPTFVVTQGLLGLLAWALFIVFFGILGIRSLRGLTPGVTLSGEATGSDQPHGRFILVSSYTAAAFLWLMCLIYVPPHAVLFLTFVMTGIWLGASVAYGRLKPFDLTPLPGTRAYLVSTIITAACFIVLVFWGIVCLKNTVALMRFGSGVKELTVTGDAVKADGYFRAAIALNPLDVYWQARAEANIALAGKLIATISPASDASTTKAVALSSANLVNQAFGYANLAIKADPDNYYNYISEARVAELATSMSMTNGFETAVAAYTEAIRRNPGNPSIYLNLARLEASKGQYDAAIQAVGASLQAKNNYLDAVFMLSQIEAAKGNLPDAITAAVFATKLNPQNALLFFQLGLLQYTKGDYTSAATSFNQALAIEPSYANASYFLGLSDARLGKVANAITIFDSLAKANPDNQDVATVLSTLRSGKSLFTGVAAPAAAPEKKAAPPLPSK